MLFCSSEAISMGKVTQSSGMVLQQHLSLLDKFIPLRGDLWQAAFVEVVDFLLTSRQELFEVLRRKLKHSQAKMKHSANIHHRDVIFNIGDWVYVKLRPYHQTSLSDKFQKLGKRFYGLYQITNSVGKVAYRLTLPSTTKIHPVFHYSKLKLHQGPIISEQSLHPASWDNNPIVSPLAILDHKWDKSNPP